MKVQEQVKNYESDRRMYTNFVVRNIKKLCKETGPRLAGSESEYEAQKKMAQELETCCDEVKIEEYSLSPWAFMGWVQIAVYCSTAAALLFFLSVLLPRCSVDIASFQLPMTIVGSVLVLAALFFVVTEFLFYKETLDPFFKKAVSHNVIAVRKAEGETKRRIIFSGHADSAPEWRFTYWGGPKLVVPAIGGGVFGVVLTLVFSIIAVVFYLNGNGDSNALWVMSIINICFVPVFLFCLLFYDKKRIVEGANDDLTGCYLSMAVPRFLEDKGIRFKNTEVMVVCTGGEESGLRGAKAFCKAHAEEIKNDGVETVYFGIDTVRDWDFMAVYNRDMTGLVHNSEEVTALIKRGAKMAGYDLPSATVSLGATDAAAISQAGLKGASFAAMDPAPARYYHTRLDTHDNLDPKTLEAAVDICLQTAFLFDEKGLEE